MLGGKKAMQTIDMIFGLHFYQPPTQRKDVLAKIVDECYRPLLDAIGEMGHIVTADICASLLEQLAERHPDVIAAFRRLAKSGLISFANTAAYHALLPLTPKKLILRQLAQNEKWYRDCELIAQDARLRGIFPPEMAFSPHLIPFLREAGCEWFVSDDDPYLALSNAEAPMDWIPEQDGMKCLLRSRLWSNRISFHMPPGEETARCISRDISREYAAKPNAYLVIWMDAETFGHHHKGAIGNFFVPFLRTVQQLPIRLTTPETLVASYPASPARIPSGSWSTSREDLYAGIPFSLWAHPEERWHELWWKLAYLAIEIADGHAELYDACDKALYSCQPWWMRYPKRNKELFLWALPLFHRVIDHGTPDQKKLGLACIYELANA